MLIKMPQHVIQSKFLGKNEKNTFNKFVDNIQVYSLNIALIAVTLLSFVFLGAMSFFYIQSPETITYKQRLEESLQQEGDRGNWKQLHKYHGYPAMVVYEEGKTPYFYDKQGRKCKFIYPSKEGGLINNKMEDPKYYAALKVNKK